MKSLLQPWQLLVLILAGWINRQEQDVIEYLRAENRVLREKLGKKRILLDDSQRRRLAIKGKILGRRMLEQVATIVTPDTILRWHRELVAAKWDYSGRRNKMGRPPVSDEIVELLLRMARENPTWGYDRIQGALANLGHEISNTSVGCILKAHGVDPAPDRRRQSTWKSFLQAHWDVLGVRRFHDDRGLDKERASHVLFALCHGTGDAAGALRRVHHKSSRSVDASGRTQSQRRRRWVPAW